jgi:hypothetical protein
MSVDWNKVRADKIIFRTIAQTLGDKAGEFNAYE